MEAWRFSEACNFQLSLSSGKAKAAVFWDSQGVLVEDFMECGTAINPETYCAALQPLWRTICRKRLRWSRVSVLAFGTQVRGFKPGRSRRIF